jgi:hypothetical protein
MPRVSVRRKRTVVVQVRLPVELRDVIARRANEDLVSLSTAARQMIAESAERQRTADETKVTHVKAAA